MRLLEHYDAVPPVDRSPRIIRASMGGATPFVTAGGDRMLAKFPWTKAG
jgi:hypothetical protein